MDNIYQDAHFARTRTERFEICETIRTGIHPDFGTTWDSEADRISREPGFCPITGFSNPFI